MKMECPAMTRSILSDELWNAVQQAENNVLTQSTSEQECLKMILIGSVERVREMIHRLHQQGIAEAGAWSRMLPLPKSQEVMSILLQYRRREA
jgi:O-succinylbenzoate synthase